MSEHPTDAHFLFTFVLNKLLFTFGFASLFGYLVDATLMTPTLKLCLKERVHYVAGKIFVNEPRRKRQEIELL